MSKNLKQKILKGKKLGKIIFAVLNILSLGFIYAALSGDMKGMDPEIKISLIFILVVLILLILMTTGHDGFWWKLLTMFFILAYVSIGVAYLALTKQTVPLMTQIFGYLGILFLGFNWMHIHWRMCKLCKPVLIRVPLDKTQEQEQHGESNA